MRKTMTVMTSLLVAVALSGTAIGTLQLDLPETAIPTGGVAGSAVGCDLSGSGFMFGYGEAGVPGSSGYGDGACDNFGYDNSGPIAYTVLKATGSGYGYTGAYGYDQATWDYANPYIFCNEPATLLVNWDTLETLYLDGGDCTVELYGTGNIEDFDWYSYGGGMDDVKFVHTDNLVDALVHLLL